jgi:DNA-binding transcriptional LysR family regulator
VTLDLDRLQFLRELAARGTMTAVAEALAYTPSAVSQGLAALERDLGVPLLEKRGRRVVLTAAGRALVRESEAVFAAAERAVSAAEAVSGTVRGPVHVGAFQSAGARLVPRAFRAVQARHPDLELHFSHWETDGRRELQLGHLDIYLDQRFESVPSRTFDGMTETTILREPVYLAVPAHDDAGPDPAAYADRIWAAAPDPTTDEHQVVLSICEAAGFEPDIRFHTDDLEVLVALVEAGLAVGILARLATFRLPDAIALHPVPGNERRVEAVVRPDAADRPAVRLVLEELAAAGAAV